MSGGIHLQHLRLRAVPGDHPTLYSRPNAVAAIDGLKREGYRMVAWKGRDQIRRIEKTFLHAVDQIERKETGRQVMFHKSGVTPQTLHLQLVYHVPKYDIRPLLQCRPLLRVQFAEPIGLEAGDSKDRQDHQRRRRWKYNTYPLSHAANIHGRTTGNPPLTLINLMPALINMMTR